MQDKSYTISILNVAHNMWQPLATVSDNITINIPGEGSVSVLMTKLCAIILELENYGNICNNRQMISAGEYGNKYRDRMKFTLIGDLKYRLGTIYYGMQYIEKSGNIRLLILATNKIHSDALSFGTDPTTIEIDTTIEDVFEDLLKEMKKEGYQADMNSHVINALNMGQYTVGVL